MAAESTEALFCIFEPFLECSFEFNVNPESTLSLECFLERNCLINLFCAASLFWRSPLVIPSGYPRPIGTPSSSAILVFKLLKILALSAAIFFSFACAYAVSLYCSCMLLATVHFFAELSRVSIGVTPPSMSTLINSASSLVPAGKSLFLGEVAVSLVFLFITIAYWTKPLNLLFFSPSSTFLPYLAKTFVSLQSFDHDSTIFLSFYSSSFFYFNYLCSFRYSSISSYLIIVTILSFSVRKSVLRLSNSSCSTFILIGMSTPTAPFRMM